MSAGLASKLNILQQSPYDSQSAPEPLPQETASTVRWSPSRYNIRVVAEDGRLVLWNSFSGTMSVFAAKQRQAIQTLLSQKGFSAKPEGIVKYLSARGFLVKEGTDEYRKVQVGFGLQHYRTDALEFILLASEDCNFRCQYCYEDFARGTMQPWVRTGIKRLVESRIGTLSRLSVEWFGGEPLYGFQAIEDLGPFFLEIARSHSIRYSSSMTTNGYLLTPEVADKLLAWGVNSFQITLDGVPADHNHNRPTRDGRGTFETIFENLSALRRRPDSYSVDIRVNFDKNNSARLHEFLEIIEQEFQGDPRFRLRFRAVGQWGGPNDPQLDVCGADDGAKVQREIKAEARRRGLKLSDDLLQVSGMGAHVCYAARPYNFIVGASGKLMKCTIDLDKHERNVVGKLGEDGKIQLDFDRFSVWTEPAFESDGKCKKCVVLPTCHGMHCPLIRIESGDSPCSPLRMGAKHELLEVVKQHAGDAHNRTVTADLR
jgi:uncharacterized protein